MTAPAARTLAEFATALEYEAIPQEAIESLERMESMTGLFD